MSKSAHSKRWHKGERYSMSKVERERAKTRKVRRKSERERRRRDNRVTECYAEQGHWSCGRKVRYESRAKALRYIERHYAEVPLSVYKCPYCGGWHLTSHPWTDADGGPLTEERYLWQEFLELARDSARQIETLTFRIENGGADRATSGAGVRGSGTPNPTESEALRRMSLLPRLEERRDEHIARVGRALVAIQSVRDRLGPTEGDILEMFYIDGLLTGEIAGELGITVDGVFYRKRKALKWMDENLPIPE